LKILILILAYAWVGLLHSFLVGTFIFAWFGKKINANNMWLWAILIFCILLFFESYWIPIFNILQISVQIQEPSILQFFNIAPHTNAVNKLQPGIITICSCLLQTALAMYIGKKHFNKK
jgi:hypothetical protein